MKRRHFLQAASLLPVFGSGLLPLQAAASTRVGNPASGQDFFYRPQGAWAADFIPLFNEGRFELFYLLDWRDADRHGEGTPWFRISTTDFVHFKEHGEMLKRGSVSEQDLYVFTGSAIREGNTYHIFYTGHNPNMRKQGKPEQGVMHAISQDLQHWKKIPEDTFFAPADKYEMHDWRDPFVFADPQQGGWLMLLAARNKSGIPRRRGLTALCHSKDLKSWKTLDAFYAPDLYFTHECPDFFKMGDWWYLIFSEFTDKVRTRYRMSRELQGPWLTPARDDFDGHAFYAAKSASDGHKRFLFGWNPTRQGDKDNGNWQWGGNLVVHELVQEAGGELGVKAPETVSSAFSKPGNISFPTGSGRYSGNASELLLDATGSFAAAYAGDMPVTCRIAARLSCDKAATDFGLMFRTSPDLDRSYYLRFEPQAQRLVFDRWPRERSDVPQMAELERPFQLKPGTPFDINLFIDGNKGVLYVDNQIAMNFRAYDFADGGWGFFATDGKANIQNIGLFTL